MDDNALQYLKQFIISMVRQEVSGINGYVALLGTKFDKLETKVVNIDAK